MRVLALTPPMTQLNTPYPATAYLTGFLRSRGVDAVQQDLAIELFHALFSLPGLVQLHEAVAAKAATPCAAACGSLAAQGVAGYWRWCGRGRRGWG